MSVSPPLLLLQLGLRLPLLAGLQLVLGLAGLQLVLGLVPEVKCGLSSLLPEQGAAQLAACTGCRLWQMVAYRPRV